jgi:small subunit ribosomal protein S17
MEDNKSKKRVLQGTVVSDKMAKTIVVRVDRLKVHPKYKKQYRMSERFKVHDEKGEYKVGDVVRFAETRPLSKGKHWRVIGKVVVK